MMGKGSDVLKWKKRGIKAIEKKFSKTSWAQKYVYSAASAAFDLFDLMALIRIGGKNIISCFRTSQDL